MTATCGDSIIHDGVEACDDGNQVDDDDCSNACQLTCSGWIYQGICLRSAIVNSETDNIPAGCNAYRPAMNWGDLTTSLFATSFIQRGLRQH